MTRLTSGRVPLWSYMQRNHKDLQVCRQVFDALSLALAEVDDPATDALILAAVEPAPSAARVLVTFVPATRDAAVDDLDAALGRLRELLPELREEVAAEVHRARVPELVLRLILPPRRDDDLDADLG